MEGRITSRGALPGSLFFQRYCSFLPTAGKKLLGGERECTSHSDSTLGELSWQEKACSLSPSDPSCPLAVKVSCSPPTDASLAQEREGSTTVVLGVHLAVAGERFPAQQNKPLPSAAQPRDSPGSAKRDGDPLPICSQTLISRLDLAVSHSSSSD